MKRPQTLEALLLKWVGLTAAASLLLSPTPLPAATAIFVNETTFQPADRQDAIPSVNQNAVPAVVNKDALLDSTFIIHEYAGETFTASISQDTTLSLRTGGSNVADLTVGYDSVKHRPVIHLVIRPITPKAEKREFPATEPGNTLAGLGTR